MPEKTLKNIMPEKELDSRLHNLRKWLHRQLAVDSVLIKPASEDASFRRYFRVWVGDKTYVAMDAPPEKEDCAAFIDITHRLQKSGIHAPKIHADDIGNGYLLLDDLGQTLYLSALDAGTVETLYGDAIDALFRMQSKVPAQDLPPYNRKQLLSEMNLYISWFLNEHLKIKLNRTDKSTINDCFDMLTSSALEQPTTFVHRDYHSRNLMVCKDSNPGILDFQDAMCGPITYDLVSLLRDCYIKWPENRIKKWRTSYYQKLLERKMISVGLDKFERWFDWMGMQRHLKAIGIFSRLRHRDGKSNFLGDIPRTYNYILTVCGRYPELGKFAALMGKLQIQKRIFQ